MSQTVETDASCDSYLSCLLLVFHEMTKLPSVNFGADVVESAVGTHAALAGAAARASEATARRGLAFMAEDSGGERVGKNEGSKPPSAAFEAGSAGVGDALRARWKPPSAAFGASASSALSA